MNTKQRELQRLVHEIFYQKPLWGGIHTMGPCSRECGNTARGCGVCLGCLEKDMAKMMPEFTRYRVEVNALINHILETRRYAGNLYDMLANNEDEKL